MIFKRMSFAFSDEAAAAFAYLTVAFELPEGLVENTVDEIPAFIGAVVF